MKCSRTMKCSHISIFTLILSYQNILTIHNKPTGNYKIISKSVTCKNFRPDIILVRECKILAVRGRNGLLQIRADLPKPLSDAWMTLKLFYRGPSGKYQPFILDMDVDVCDTLNHLKSSNKLIKLIFSFLIDLNPNHADGCPLIDPIRIEGWDLDKTAQQFMPPVMPEGTFISFTRLHSTKNVTYVVTEFKFEIKGIGITDMIKLG